MKASEERIKSLESLERKMTALSERNFRSRKKYLRYLTIWQTLSRLVTIGCVIMSTLIGNSKLSLNPSTVTTLGVALAISNCVNGTIGEILAKLNEKLTDINESITLITLAKIKLMKSFDSATDDGFMDMKEYQGILDALAGAIKKLSQQGLDDPTGP